MLARKMLFAILLVVACGLVVMVMDAIRDSPRVGVGNPPGIAGDPSPAVSRGEDPDRRPVSGESERGLQSGVRSPEESASDLVQAMHLHQAPRDIQKSYAGVAEMEIQNFLKRADAIAPSSTASLDNYLSFLIASREARMRDLARHELISGNGVLYFDGLKPLPDANRPKLTYLGVGSFYGRQADLIVWIGDDKGQVDPQLAALSESVQQVAMNSLGDLVAKFNQRPRGARQADLTVFRAQGTLSGFSQDLLFVVGSRLRVDDATATLVAY